MLSPTGLTLLLLVAGRPQDGELIVAHAAVGPLRHDMSEAELVRRVGARNVAPAVIGTGEGICYPGTIVYPDDPSRRFEVVWGNNRPALVYVDPNASRYHTASGVRVGLALAELEKLNGTSIGISGFGWDFSGGLTDFQHGKLERELEGIFVATEPTQNAEHAPLGDRLLQSSDPEVRAVRPAVSALRIELGPLLSPPTPCPSR